VEQACGQPYQEVWLCGEGTQGHAAAEAGRPEQGWYIQLEVLNTDCSLQERLAEPPLLVKQACGNPDQTDWLCGEGHQPMLLLKQESLTKIWSIQPEVLNKNCSLQAWFAEPLLLVEQACGQPYQEVWLCGEGTQVHGAAEAGVR